MKKRQVAFFALSLMLAGCGTQNNASENETAESQKSQTSSALQESNKSEESSSSEELNQATEEELSDAEQVNSVMEYEEMETVQKEVNLNEYDAYLFTDNPGSRVVVFMEGNQQVYKTIFVKNNKQLKVVDLQENQLIVNQKID